MPELDTEGLLKRLAKGKPLAAILLLGGDAFLRKTCRDKIIETYVNEGNGEWAVARFSADDDPVERVIGQAQMLPMLAPRQVIVWSDVEALERLSDESRDNLLERLEGYFEDPAPFSVLVLEAAALDQRTKIFKSLVSRMLVVSCELSDELPERIAQTAVMVAEMAREANVRIEQDAAQALAEATNADLASMRTEIEKLATYVGERGVIGRADVEAIVVSDQSYSVWQLSEMLASGDRARAFEFLESLLRGGEQPVALVGAIAWMFRKLIEVQDLPKGAGAWDAARHLSMRRDTAELALREAPKIPRRQLEAGLIELAEADNRLKSGTAAPRAVMEFLIARLTDSRGAKAIAGAHS